MGVREARVIVGVVAVALAIGVNHCSPLFPQFSFKTVGFFFPHVTSVTLPVSLPVWHSHQLRDLGEASGTLGDVSPQPAPARETRCCH